MYTVKRAIIMAAGLGNRMKPLTATIPKPLIKVNGITMIESVINALHQNGIYEIYVVVGYLKEQFSYLEKKYPDLKLLTNDNYATCNNISSLYVAKDYLEDVIILDGDQIIYNHQILDKHFNKSGYNAIWTNDKTDEWLLTVENDKIVKCSRTGGKTGWQLFSVSRWAKEDGSKLRQHLIQEFEINKNYQIYWDDIALFCYPQFYDLGIFPMKKKDIIEIDSYQELVALDHSYPQII